MFDPRRGHPVCFSHTSYRFARGQQVRVRQQTSAGFALPHAGQLGVIFTMLRGGAYEVRLRGTGVREIYYDWELDAL